MELKNFKRRKCDVERYQRALKVLTEITFGILVSRMKKIIDCFEIESKIIEFFCSNPNVIEVEYKSSKDGKLYKLPIRVIGRDSDGRYFVTDGILSCRLVGENYANERLNRGADYHSLRVTSETKYIDYWASEYQEFLLFQLNNQDKLEELCKELNKMGRNYFSI